MEENMRHIQIKQEGGYNISQSFIMNPDTIEQMILTRTGDWTFDYHVSKVFDIHVRKSIPCYDEIQSLIADISKKLLTDHAIVYDLGTATGEVICNIFNANKTRKLTFVGIDLSSHMLKIAKEKCHEIKNVTFYNERIETFNYSPSDLIVSAFTIQFIDIKNRKQVLQRIKDMLNPDGSFILCEKMSFQNNKVNEIFRQIHEDWKLNYFSSKEIISKRNSLKNVMQLLTISEYSDLLMDVGFKQIDTFFQWGNFVCILAK